LDTLLDRAGKGVDQPPDAIVEGADAALAAELGVIAGAEASVDGAAGALIELLALVSGAGVVVALEAGASAVFEQPASENTAAKAMAESVVNVLSRVIAWSCRVLWKRECNRGETETIEKSSLSLGRPLI